MHENLPPAVEVEYAGALKRLEAHLGGVEHNVWKLFAGGAVTSKAAKEYYNLLRSRYSVDLKVETAVMAERDVWKMNTLKVQHPEVPVLVMECDALAARHGVVHNERTGKGGCILPECFGYDGGIPCTSVTPLSSQSKENADCIQRGTDAQTATGWRAFFGGVKIHQPEVGAAECVRQLLIPGVPGGKSDGVYMCEELRKLGFWATVQELDTFDYAGWIGRTRAWWAFARLQAPASQVDAFFNKLLDHFKLTDMGDFKLFPAERFISFSAVQRKAEAAALKVPEWSAFGIRPLKSENGGWKAEHLQAFEAIRLPWPVVDFQSFTSNSYIQFAGCTPRQCEMLIYLDMAFPPQHHRLEFCDVNPAFNRVLQGFLDEDWRPRTDAKGSPWKQSSPTQVGSGRMAIRQHFTFQKK